MKIKSSVDFMIDLDCVLTKDFDGPTVEVGL